MLYTMHPALRKGPLFFKKNIPHFSFFYKTLPISTFLLKTPPISFHAYGPPVCGILAKCNRYAVRKSNMKRNTTTLVLLYSISARRYMSKEMTENEIGIHAAKKHHSISPSFNFTGPKLVQ